MTPSEPSTPEKRYLLDDPKPFGQCGLWELQRLYYSSKGVDAWRGTEVPYYVTNNPVIANSYAELVFALHSDQNRLAPVATSKLEPIHICELGAGSGRFAFHFLKRLQRICEEGRVDPAAFCYVLTDQAESNLQFWLGHPSFQPYFKSGLLDVALFEASHSSELALRVSGRTVVAGALERPVVVIANYFLDTIPQDLFRVDEQGFHQCLISLVLEKDPRGMSIGQILADVELQYEYEPVVGQLYDQPWLQQIIDSYLGAFKNTHLVIPAEGLLCFHRLKALSKAGLMLLSADKGNHRLDELDRREAPEPARHGSFSLGVNYHAIKAHAEQSGGLALFPDSHHNSINVSCCLILPEALEHLDVRQAYRRHVAEFGPDDFSTIVTHSKESIPRMTLQQIMVYLRLAQYDSEMFARVLMRLIELAPEFNQTQRSAFVDTVERVWDLYFPMGEKMNLANGIGCLLFKLNEHALALKYFEISMATQGENAGEMINVALCCDQLGQWEKARLTLEKVLASDPGNASALELMETCAAHERERVSG